MNSQSDTKSSYWVPKYLLLSLSLNNSGPNTILPDTILQWNTLTRRVLYEGWLTSKPQFWTKLLDDTWEENGCHKYPLTLVWTFLQTTFLFLRESLIFYLTKRYIFTVKRICISMSIPFVSIRIFMFIKGWEHKNDLRWLKKYIRTGVNTMDKGTNPFCSLLDYVYFLKERIHQNLCTYYKLIN